MNLQHFLMKNIAPRGEFFCSDQFPLDDESIADTAINAMLLVMNNSTRASCHTQNTIIDDYAPLVAAGVRFPWKERIALSRNIDNLNDEMPKFAAIGLTKSTKGIFASAVSCSTVRHEQLPTFAKRALSGSIRTYRTTYIEGYDGLSRGMATRKSRDLETVIDGGFAGMMPDGFVVGVTDSGAMSAWHAEMLAYVVSLYNDRRYFWEVTAAEQFWDGHPAKAIFSIDEEYIKSLFYARSLPITSTGRMRPILHWVSAHKRRIKEGINIDIRKHLRGVDSFAMHGVNFSITEPRKPATPK